MREVREQNLEGATIKEVAVVLLAVSGLYSVGEVLFFVKYNLKAKVFLPALMDGVHDYSNFPGSFLL